MVKQNKRKFSAGLLYSLRTRLQVMTFVIVLLPMLLAGWSSLHLLKKHLAQDMHHQLESSISAAVLSYAHEINRIEQAIMAVSLNNTVKTTLRLEIFGQLKRELEQLANLHHLDFLVLTDGMGDLLVSPFPGLELSRDLYSHPVLYEAMMQGSYSGTILEENATLLYFLELEGKNIECAPIVTIEAASPVIVRDRVIGYVIGGVMATGNQQLMTTLRDSANSDTVTLVAGNRIAAGGANHTPFLARGDRFPVQLDYRKGQFSEKRLRTLSSSGRDEVFEYHILEMPEQESMLALVSSYSLAEFYHLLANIRNSMVVIFILAMLLATLLTTLLSRSVAAPLHQLTVAMGKVRRRGIYELLPPGRDDETGALITGYNQMATTIDERFRDLNSEVGQRREAEQRLAAESERLQVTLQSIADGVMTVDTDGRIVLLNTVAAELTGWNQDKAVGALLKDVFVVRSLRTGQTVDKLLSPILEQGRKRMVEGDLVLTSLDKRETQVTESCAPLTDNHGNVIGVVIAFRDVSDQRLLEEELAKSAKLESVGILAGGIAHDFNNLLTAILGNLSLAKMEAGEQTDLYQHLAQAEQASLRARDLTLQLLTFSRGGAPVKRSEDLAALIRASALFVARGTSVDLDFVISDDLRRAVVDKGQIGQVVDNLVINGIQAMPEGGTISISAVNIEVRKESLLPLEAGNYIKISVEDQGSGFAPGVQEKIFDPYFTTKESGNGLGLSICYSIVSKHGGYIAARSGQQGGARFDVYLPAAEDTPVPLPEPVAEQDGRVQRAGRILVMDDEEMVRKVSEAMLQSMGYEVVSVADGAEALQVYREALGTKNSFAGVILDMTVPGGMGGEETVLKMRNLDPSLKAIVSSGYSRHAVMADYHKYGFDGVVAKPYRLKDMSRAVKEVFG